MKILSSSVSTQSSHEASVEQARQERLRVWVGQQAVTDTSKTPLQAHASQAMVVAFSAEAQSLAASRAVKTTASGTANPGEKPESQDYFELAPDDAIDAEIVQRTFHLKSLRVQETHRESPEESSTAGCDPQNLPQAPPATPSSDSEVPRAGWGMQYDRTEHVVDRETTQFLAKGQVQTADGRCIDFQTAVRMQRAYQLDEAVSIQAGDVPKTDPLVINMDGGPVDLAAERMSFDLDSDGTAESIPLLAEGHGFLAIDRNADGQINNGGELLGPTTGSGFAELAALDQDSNGWIDEADSAYGQLRIWQPETDGTGSLTTLQQARVGAIQTQATETPFSIRNEDNETQAVVQKTAVQIDEDGVVGTVQHVDFVG